MCDVCKPHKCRGASRSAKDPVAVNRRIDYARRYGRHTAKRDQPLPGSPRQPSPFRHSDVLTVAGCMDTNVPK